MPCVRWGGQLMAVASQTVERTPGVPVPGFGAWRGLSKARAKQYESGPLRAESCTWPRLGLPRGAISYRGAIPRPRR